MSEKKIQMDGIGLVTFFKSSRAKNINIRLQPMGGVKVSVPKNISFKIAQKLVVSKMDWIKNAKKKVKVIEEGYTFFTENTEFVILNNVIKIRPHLSDRMKIRYLTNEIVINYPAKIEIDSDVVQTEIRKNIEKILRKEAKIHLTQRVDFFANRFQLQYSKIFFKAAKTRWGSCSATNNINLNIHLMRLPTNLIDYVIIHELAHIKEKNHSKKFWSLVDKYTNGKGKIWDRQLNNFTPKIY